MRFALCRGFSNYDLVKLFKEIESSDNPGYRNMDLVYDQLKCLGSSLKYWEAIAIENGGSIYFENNLIILDLPDDFKEVDKSMWKKLSDEFKACGNCGRVMYYPFPSFCDGCNKDPYQYVPEEIEDEK